MIRRELGRLHGAGEAADYVLDALGDRSPEPTSTNNSTSFRPTEGRVAMRPETMSLIRTIAERTYGIEFADDSPLSERVLWPAMGAEAAGMEDARFVRFVDDDGSVTFYASYTAYSGSHISQQLLRDGRFPVVHLDADGGPAAANKGLALFPRRIRGRFAAMSQMRTASRTRLRTRIIRSCGPTRLAASGRLEAWEALQLGNCGPPIETEAGWLVLTHGVGPMRTYRIGAMLLDLEDPTRILGQLREPLLSPAADEQDGYVPNVVYSCGALVHADTWCCRTASATPLSVSRRCRWAIC